MNETTSLGSELAEIKNLIYDKCLLVISNFNIEPESREYGACQFQLNDLYIVCRNAKTTPKKVGQFVTFWKREENGPIEPFDEKDQIDYYAVIVKTETQFGQFVFPRSVLIAKGIISTVKKEGKRAFRVYPPWDIAINKQAQQTQKWQLNYFYLVDSSTDLKHAKELYAVK